MCSTGAPATRLTPDGLKKFPLAGKTGTAYNFTDDWFIGYSSAITCGVWAGFDKPGSIYRGAFSSDVVLPVWVDIMNSSFQKYPASEIPQPRAFGSTRFAPPPGNWPPTNATRL